MDWRSLPPLAALRAFAAFHQTGSVVAAGDALGVSHAAISQQLRALEAHLDAALLDRSGRALRLTTEGEQLAQTLRGGFALMGEGVAQIAAAREERPLHISTTPNFAASWLMPRLPVFRASHPDIDLMIDPTPKIVTLTADGIDVAIRYGTGGWPAVESVLLWESAMVVVGAPALVADLDPGDAQALADLPWIEEFGMSEASRWRYRMMGETRRGSTLQVPGNLLLDGARDGQGVTVVPRRFVDRDIDAGRLTVLHEEVVPGTGYHIVTRPGALRPPLKAFVAWLRREARVP